MARNIDFEDSNAKSRGEYYKVPDTLIHEKIHPIDGSKYMTHPDLHIF